MPTPPAEALPPWLAVLLAVPATLALATAVTAMVVPPRRGWQVARRSGVAMAVAATAVVAAVASVGSSAGALVRADAISAAGLSLVGLIGWVVIRYSATYLAGEPGQRRYLSRLAVVLAAVSIVVVTNDLALLVAAWVTTSAALHGLLTFYGDRPEAVVAAHKKFLLARCSELCLVAAAIVLWSTFDTTRIDRIVAEATTSPMPGSVGAAIVLVCMAVALRCAQLPFHGWLLQVMEAPTPVSALLHAGVVNLGGFVLLRFAPVIDATIAARTLLVVVGCSTAVLAALIMTTRTSIKVALAWSTCAQMGFMLLQAGLGVWELVLLHLLAHSAYKAHAFLAAGGVVQANARRQLLPAPPPPTAGRLVGGAALAIAVTAAVGLTWFQLPGTTSPSPVLWVLGGITALATVTLALPAGSHGAPLLRRPGVVLVPFAYFAWHEVFARLTPHGTTPPAALLVLVAVAFAGLFAAQCALTLAPHGRFAGRLHPWLYGGLFLDDAFTRAAFALWPPPEPHGTTTVLGPVRSVPVLPTGGAAPLPTALTAPAPAPAPAPATFADRSFA